MLGLSARRAVAATLTLVAAPALLPAQRLAPSAVAGWTARAVALGRDTARFAHDRRLTRRVVAILGALVLAGAIGVGAQRLLERLVQ